MGAPIFVESYDFDGGRVFFIGGELDVSSAQRLTGRLRGQPGSLIVVDLSQLTFLDSSGLGLLHEARQLAIADGGSLVVCNPSQMARRVFEITGLDTWITDWDPRWSDGVPSEPSADGPSPGDASGPAPHASASSPD